MKPVNLNQARKVKTRLDKRAKADANAAKFGMTKAEKIKNKAQDEITVSRLEAHKQEK